MQNIVDSMELHTQMLCILFSTDKFEWKYLLVFQKKTKEQILLKKKK